MALSDKVKAGEAAQAQSQATPTPAKPEGGATGKASESKAFKDSGASLRSQMSEDEKKIEGSKSDKVAFICALGDPNRKQSRVQGKESIGSYVVVGYKFKILEDTTVPFAPYREDMKSVVDVEPATERPVKAGEIVGLNIVETAMFITRLEYAGKFSGEGNTVIISTKSAKDRAVPLPILMKKGDGSIKEGIELIADMVGQDATHKGTPKIKDEYKDSFSALYAKKTISKKGAGANKKSGESYADIAAAFRNLYSKQQ